MMKIALTDFGEFLGTRFLGELVRSEISRRIDTDEVEVDFSGISGVSHSFADECFGVLLSEIGIEVFKEKLQFKHLGHANAVVLRFVLSDRMQTAGA